MPGVWRWSGLVGLLGLAAGAAAAGKPTLIVHLYTGGETAMVVGASQGSQWLNWEKAARLVKAGTSFRFYSAAAAVGSRSVKKPTLSAASGSAYNAELTRPLPTRKALLGVSGATWKLQPRAARNVAGEEGVRTAVSALLKSKGIPDPKVEIQIAWHVDLDGDGRQETVIGAGSPGYARLMREGGPVPAGAFSAVFLRAADGTLTTVAGAIHVKANDAGGAPEQYTAGQLADLNGDGSLEIVVLTTYYEGGGVVVVQYRGGRIKAVLQASDGA